MEPDLARIAFVTRRFEELQGLTLAALGAAVVLWSVAWTFLPADRDPFIHVLLPAHVTAVMLIPRVGEYYQRSFGRAPASRRQGTPQRSAWHAGGPGFRIVLLGVAVDLVKGLAGAGGISCGALAVSGYSLWVLIRDWPNRLHHSIGLAAGLAGVVVTAGVPIAARLDFRIDPLVASEYVFTYALAGVGLLAVGLLDHRLLATAMCSRPPVRETGVVPDASLVQIRLAISCTCLAALLTCIGVFGWPRHAFTLHMTLYLALLGSAIVAYVCEVSRTLRSYLTLDEQWARARERRFLSQIAATKGGPPPEVEDSQDPASCAAPDLLGHVALPFLMACGAVVDVMSRGGGMPSLLALALAASHLRIATRDWPRRRHYLLGFVAGAVSAVHYMVIGGDQAIDWLVVSAIVVSAAMAVEGLLDLRLARRTAFRDERHADSL